MSVQNLRKTYLNKGQLSVCRDPHGKPYVEVVEALRVFPDFQMPGQVDAVAGNRVAAGFQQLQHQNDQLNGELQTLRARLHTEEQRRMRAEENEAWLRNHVDQLARDLTLLAAPAPAAPATPPAKKPGWFGRLLGRR